MALAVMAVPVEASRSRRSWRGRAGSVAAASVLASATPPGPPRRSRRPMPGTATISSTVAARSRFSEPNCLQQRLAPGLPEPGDVVERDGGHRLGALLPVVGDREPVGLVAHPLQQVERLAEVRGRITGSGVAGQPDLLQPLGQPADGDVVDAELGQRRGRGGDLRRAAVDDDQVGRVGELRRAGRLRRSVDRPGSRVRVPARRPALLEVAAEPPADHLVHRGDVVVPSVPLTANRRYSLLRARPSSNTTMLATTLVPCRCETS